MQEFFLVVHVLLALALIGLILIQHGRGADAGAAFGSGASGTVFGARGSTSFLTKLTTFLAIGFFANSLALAYLSAKQPQEQSLIDQIQQQAPLNNDVPPAAIENEGAAPPADIPSEAGASESQQPADVPDLAE